MSDSSLTETTTPLDLHAIRNRVKELCEVNYWSFFGKETDTKDLLSDYVSALEQQVKEFETESTASLSAEDFDRFTEYLQDELSTKEAERHKLSSDTEGLKGNILKAYADCSQLEGELELLSYPLDLIALQGQEAGNAAAFVDLPMLKESRLVLINGLKGQKLEIFRLEEQEKEIKRIKEFLVDLDCAFKWLDTLQEMEEHLTGLKVEEFDEKYIRLSLQRDLPNLENFYRPTPRLNYELLIELSDGTMEVEKAKITPDDVYIDDIIDATKSFRQSEMVLLGTRSLLEWFVRHVVDRVVVSKMRRLLVENANNKSRHSFEYIDRDEMIVAHMVSGVDVSIKVSSGWPITNFPLNLISHKDDQHLRRASSSFLYRVEEAANCMNEHVRQDLLRFANAVENLVLEQMNKECHSDSSR